MDFDYSWRGFWSFGQDCHDFVLDFDELAWMSDIFGFGMDFLFSWLGCF